jgi:hypothetical protein
MESNIFNRKISSNIEDLEKLHQRFMWIPGMNNVSPSKNIIFKKYLDSKFRGLVYKSIKDYIYIRHFQFKPTLNKEGKLECLQDDIRISKAFVKNDYPYDLPYNTEHYVLWYSHFNFYRDDNKINSDIYESLFKLLGHTKFEFVWYENPKMSVPDLYHLQVFWRLTTLHSFPGS